MGEIPSNFTTSNLCFMASRKSRSRILNTRDGNDRPIFSPDGSRLFDLPFVLNDFIADQRIIVGSFADAVFIRSGPATVQRMSQQYRERGDIGFRFVQRSDWGFFVQAGGCDN